MFYNEFNPGSIEQVQDEHQTSFTIAAEHSLISSERTEDLDGRSNSSNIRTSACLFSHSVSALPDKPAMIQERILDSDQWYGRTIKIEEESIVLDVRNTLNQNKCLKLRVKKNIVEGDLERLCLGMGVIVTYKRVRNFQDAVEKSVSVRLREPVEIPVDILNREFEIRKRRFSYMFSEGDNQ